MCLRYLGYYAILVILCYYLGYYAILLCYYLGYYNYAIFFKCYYLGYYAILLCYYLGYFANLPISFFRAGKLVWPPCWCLSGLRAFGPEPTFSYLWCYWGPMFRQICFDIKKMTAYSKFKSHEALIHLECATHDSKSPVFEQYYVSSYYYNENVHLM